MAAPRPSPRVTHAPLFPQRSSARHVAAALLPRGGDRLRPARIDPDRGRECRRNRARCRHDSAPAAARPAHASSPGPADGAAGAVGAGPDPQAGADGKGDRVSHHRHPVSRGHLEGRGQGLYRPRLHARRSQRGRREDRAVLSRSRLFRARLPAAAKDRERPGDDRGSRGQARQGGDRSGQRRAAVARQGQRLHNGAAGRRGISSAAPGRGGTSPIWPRSRVWRPRPRWRPAPRRRRPTSSSNSTRDRWSAEPRWSTTAIPAPRVRGAGSARPR